MVTGRFVTRESGDLVRVALADGSAVVGTAIHPVWSPADGDWRALGDFRPGMVVQTRGGLVEVVSVEAVAGRPPVYNIEIDGEHVYEVGDAGVLVHNGNDKLPCAELMELMAKYGKDGKLAEHEAARMVELSAKLNAPHLHHSIPKEIQKNLPAHLQNDRDIIGRPGLPNKITVDAAVHLKDVHSKKGISSKLTGIFGGKYNLRFHEEIMANGGYATISKQKVLEIRDLLVKEFGL